MFEDEIIVGVVVDHTESFHISDRGDHDVGWGQPVVSARSEFGLTLLGTVGRLLTQFESFKSPEEIE